ncbi:MAG: methyltransferase domain-containing protein [Streptosporangiales bacterium]|nr:methyltransferase domain-containing protein [Streptosporangiales bacterium]
MHDVGGVALRLQPLLARLFGEDLPLRVRCWDGSELGPPDAPTFVIRHRRALRRLLWQPGELGLARAYVAGELDIEGDVFAALRAAMQIVERGNDPGIRLGRDDKKELIRTAVTLGAVGPEPRPPAEEVRLFGEPDSRGRTAAAIRHHYDVSNGFYEKVLGSSMIYSSGYWTRGDEGSGTLEDAQHDKCAVVARKLGLAPGMRLLDMGCGWGTFAVYAAKRYGVQVVGVTMSDEQAEYARKRVAHAGLSDRVEIRVQDHRDVGDGPYDAIASLGMAEHTGREHYRQYAAALCRLLRPGGRVLCQQLDRRPGPLGPRPTFMTSYVFPDGEIFTLGHIISVLEGVGLEVHDVEGMRAHQDRTMRCWVDNLIRYWEDCVALTSPGRARVWLLYMVGSALACEAGRLGAHQVLAVRRGDPKFDDLPMTRAAWMIN